MRNNDWLGAFTFFPQLVDQMCGIEFREQSCQSAALAVWP